MVSLLGHERMAASLGESGRPSKPGNLENFLTPESMLTPGVAGAVTMTIANTLHVSLGAPPAWTALLVSFTFGFLVLAEDRKLPVRTVLYVLNSLVIFCVAWGMNSVGGADGKPAVTAFSMPSFTAPALAQSPDAPASSDVRNAEACAKASAAVGAAQARGASQADIDRMLKPCRELSHSVTNRQVTSRGLAAGPGPDQPASQGQRGFFSPWRF